MAQPKKVNQLPTHLNHPKSKVMKKDFIEMLGWILKFKNWKLFNPWIHPFLYFQTWKGGSSVECLSINPYLFYLTDKSSDSEEVK